MSGYVNKAIERLKQDKDRFERAAELQMALWRGEKPEKQPLLLQCGITEEDDENLPAYNTKVTHYDSEKMFISGLRGMMGTAYGGAEAVPSMRANMGVGIFPSLFGIKQELFEDKMPWVQDHLPKDVLMKMSPEDLKISDEFKAGLEHMEYMAQKLEGTGCLVFPMDLQGSFDTAHIVYGDAIFYDIYDDPEFLHHLLELSCEAIFMGMEECFKVIPHSDTKVAHYNQLVMPRSKGGIKISEDTSTLLSKEQIDEFIAPYMHKILAHFGGGYIHYCGKNPHLFDTVLNEPLALGVNFGNPEKHDMEDILKRLSGAGKIYYGGIPKKSDETLEAYFARYLSASRNGGRSLLLLSYTCKLGEQETVMEAWDKANL